jgi:hypothetical protein
MNFTAGPQEDFLNHAVFINQKSGAVQALVGAAIQVLFAPNAVLLNNTPLTSASKGNGRLYLVLNFWWLVASFGLMPITS